MRLRRRRVPLQAGEAGRLEGRQLLFDSILRRSRDRHRCRSKTPSPRAARGRAARRPPPFPGLPTPTTPQLADADVRALSCLLHDPPPVKAPNRPNTALYFRSTSGRCRRSGRASFLAPAPIARSWPRPGAGTAAPISPKSWPAARCAMLDRNLRRRGAGRSSLCRRPDRRLVCNAARHQPLARAAERGRLLRPRLAAACSCIRARTWSVGLHGA